MTEMPLAIVGVGKIARDQHVPAIAGSDRFTLAATVSHSHTAIDDLPTFETITELVRHCPAVQAVSLCTPPRGRLALVEEALGHGLHVMLEKPPAATLSEAEAIAAASRAAGRTLFASWHSREAAAVAPARDWLAGRTIRQVSVSWKENVRVWHPGQEWIWEPGIGVFDPGINALSILTSILPPPLLVLEADLAFPKDRAAPIAATLSLQAGIATPVAVEFDFDQRGPQTWEIRIESDDGVMRLVDGGARLLIHDQERTLDSQGEYPGLYRRFAALIAAGKSDVDLAPFRLVADSFILGQRRTVAAFDWSA